MAEGILDLSGAAGGGSTDISGKVDKPTGSHAGFVGKVNGDENDVVWEKLKAKEIEIDTTNFANTGDENTLNINKNDDTLKKIIDKIENAKVKISNALKSVTLATDLNIVELKAKEPLVSVDDLLFEFQNADGTLSFIVTPLDHFVDIGAIKKIEYKTNNEKETILELTKIDDSKIEIDLKRFMQEGIIVGNNILFNNAPLAAGNKNNYFILSEDDGLNKKGIYKSDNTDWIKIIDFTTKKPLIRLEGRIKTDSELPDSFIVFTDTLLLDTAGNNIDTTYVNTGDKINYKAGEKVKESVFMNGVKINQSNITVESDNQIKVDLSNVMFGNRLSVDEIFEIA